jgi:CHAD domain-containing protein
MVQPISFSIANEHLEQNLTQELSDNFPIIEDLTATESLTFFDTFDWRLFNASLILNRSGNQYVLRQLKKTNNILQSQAVDSQPKFLWEFPEGALREQLEPIVQMRALLKLVEVELSSTSYRILNEEEKTVARITYESFKSKNGEELYPPVKQLCLKPVRGYAKPARKIEHHLRSMGLEPDQESFFHKVLATADKTPGDYSTKLDLKLDPRMRSDETTKFILRFLLQTMRRNEAGIKNDIDTEFLHDFRVAVRRTRSALSQIKGVFPEDITLRFKRDFADIGKFTGDLRDLDVYLLAEDTYKAMLPHSLRSDIDPLMNYLKQKRLTALQRVISELNSRKYADILHDWEAFLNEPAFDWPVAINAMIPIIDLARSRIYKKYRRILKRGKQILEEMEDERLHALRIECKKLRYLMEFFESLFPNKEITFLIKQVKKLQANLGDFNDLCVQEDYLQHIIGEMPLTDSTTKRVILAIGCLIGTLQQERAVVKSHFAQTFAAFATPANKKLFKQLFATRKQASAL